MLDIPDVAQSAEMWLLACSSDLDDPSSPAPAAADAGREHGRIAADPAAGSAFGSAVATSTAADVQAFEALLVRLETTGVVRRRSP